MLAENDAGLTETNQREQRGDSCNTTIAFNTPVGKDAMNPWVTQSLRASISDQHWELIPNSMVHHEHSQKQGLASAPISRQSRALCTQCQEETLHKMRYYAPALQRWQRWLAFCFYSKLLLCFFACVSIRTEQAPHFAKSYQLLSEYLSYLSIWISLGDGKFTVQHHSFPRKAV